MNPYIDVASHAAAAVLASAAIWFGLAVPRIEAAQQKARADVATLQAEYQKGRADGEAAGRQAQLAEQAKAQEANDARLKEYAAIAAAAAGRPPAVVRVCPPGARPSAPAGDRPAGAAPGDALPAGPVAEPHGSDPGAVLAADLRRYADDAERMSADLRSAVASCR